MMVADHGVAFLRSELYKSIINKSLMFCSQVTGFIPNNKYINIIKIQASITLTHFIYIM